MTFPYEVKAAALFRNFLECFFTPDELEGPHLDGTPERVVRAWWELFGPQNYDFKKTTFPNDEGLDQMVIIEDIPVYSMCAHHFLPFFGKAHIAYIPAGSLLGLSKFARIVQAEARHPHVQEVLTWDITTHLERLLDPIGVAVVLQCEHLCMSMRGIQVPGHRTTTSVMRGVFLEKDNLARTEFLTLVGGK